MGLEHKVEVSWLCKCPLVSTYRTWSIEIYLVCTETGLTNLTVNHWVREVGNVATGFPYPWMHQDGGIETYDVVMHSCHFLPPEVTDIVLELNAHRTVVISTVKSAIDF